MPMSPLKKIGCGLVFQNNTENSVLYKLGFLSLRTTPEQSSKVKKKKKTVTSASAGGTRPFGEISALAELSL